MHELHRDAADDVQANHALRLGLREVKGLSEDDAKLIVARRRRADGGDMTYDSIRDLWLRTGLSPRVLERLADADAFGSLGLSRRDALWTVKALGRAGDKDDLPLFRAMRRHPETHAPGNDFREPEIRLPPMPLGEEVLNDYRFLHLSLRAHPASFLRADLARKGIVKNEELRRLPSSARVTVSGLITCRQRPGSANGVIFMTIEDETALANIIVWPQTFESFRPIVLGARYIAAKGKLQHDSGVIHVVADRLDDLTPLLARLAEENNLRHEALARCDEVRRPVNELREQVVNGGRRPRLHSLLNEFPELAADLDVPARGSAHAPTRRAMSRPTR
jgi:error-prone DNA polymerase